MNTFCMFPYLYYLVCLWLNGSLHSTRSLFDNKKGRAVHVWNICTSCGYSIMSERQARLFRCMIFPFRVHFRFLARYILRIGGWNHLGRGYMERILCDAEGDGEVYTIDSMSCNSDLFYSMGKFLFIDGYDAETSKHVKVLFDHYIFYDWCSCQHHFSRNCTCPKEARTWATIEPAEKYLGFMRRLLDWANSLHYSHRLSPIGQRWSVRFHRWLARVYHVMDFSISDRFMSHIGRPFMTVGIIEVEDDNGL